MNIFINKLKTKFNLVFNKLNVILYFKVIIILLNIIIYTNYLFFFLNFTLNKKFNDKNNNQSYSLKYII